IASQINDLSPQTRVKMFNIAKYDKHAITTDVLKSKAIAVGSPTVLNDVMSSVSGWMTFLKSLKFKNKKAAAFGCYGWSGESVKILQEDLAKAGFDVVDASLRVNWNPTRDDLVQAREVAEALLA
ncbi:MAG: flavodoxin domain-containing protein, partial [Eubacteriales bacterium]|nr:flavodoxin domain-containing protein [Eubacteriales bacterium]